MECGQDDALPSARRLTFVSVFLTMTLAPVMAGEVASLTWPKIMPRVSWAVDVAANSSMNELTSCFRVEGWSMLKASFPYARSVCMQ